MNARDDKQRQFAYRAAVADSVAKVGKELGSVIGTEFTLLSTALQCPVCTESTMYTSYLLYRVCIYT